MADKKDFLINMYSQLSSEIDRQIKMSWEIFGVLIGAVALLALVEKKVINEDIACSLIILMGAWVCGHLIESNYWYNRNLVIITNIERQFLDESDLNLIHPYFSSHRGDKSFLTIFKINLQFTLGLLCVVVIYHFTLRIVPGFHLTWKNSHIDYIRLLPYIVQIVFTSVILHLYHRRIKNFHEFKKLSPGRVIATQLVFDSGHSTK
jgi:hypothetical protein